MTYLSTHKSTPFAGHWPSPSEAKSDPSPSLWGRYQYHRSWQISKSFGILLQGRFWWAPEVIETGGKTRVSRIKQKWIKREQRSDYWICFGWSIALGFDEFAACCETRYRLVPCRIVPCHTHDFEAFLDVHCCWMFEDVWGCLMMFWGCPATESSPLQGKSEAS